jgi:hypothetical protein
VSATADGTELAMRPTTTGSGTTTQDHPLGSSWAYNELQAHRNRHKWPKIAPLASPVDRRSPQFMTCSSVRLSACCVVVPVPLTYMTLTMPAHTSAITRKAATTNPTSFSQLFARLYKLHLRDHLRCFVGTMGHRCAPLSGCRIDPVDWSRVVSWRRSFPAASIVLRRLLRGRPEKARPEE